MHCNSCGEKTDNENLYCEECYYRLFTCYYCQTELDCLNRNGCWTYPFHICNACGRSKTECSKCGTKIRRMDGIMQETELIICCECSDY